MIFKSVFNWLKYKTLPPSVLFKNRLFLERDTKNRRIMTNLGLTYRNSKWSSYQRRNISNFFPKTFLKLLRNFIILFFISFIFFTFFLYYNNLELYNEVLGLLWFFFDSTLYSCFNWYFFILVSTQHFFSYIVQRIFGTTKYSLYFNTANFNSLNLNINAEYNKPILPKNLHKPLLYTWLTENTISSKELSNFIDSVGTQQFFLRDLSLLQSLYKFVYTLNLCKVPNLHYTYSKDSFKHTLPVLARNTTCFNNYTGLIISYYLKYDMLTKKHLFLEKPSLSFLKTRSNWNLYFLDTEFSKFNTNIHIKNGSFYNYRLPTVLLNFSFSNFSEFFFLNNGVTDRAKILKWNYWLYKYNILHRTILKNSSNLTIFKKLLGVGFYNSKLKTDNMWFSNEYSGLINESFLNNIKSGHLNTYFYNSCLTSTKQLNLTNFKNFYNNPRTKPKLSAFYENSYIWFLKRCYKFNSLSNNLIHSGYNLQPVYTQKLDLSTLFFNFFITNTLKSSLLSNNLFTSQVNQPNFCKNTPYLSSRVGTKLSFLDYKLKDVYLFYLKPNVLNLSTFHILFSLTQNRGLGKESFYFLFYNTNNHGFNEYSFKPLSTGILPNKQFINDLRFLNAELFLLEDLFLFSNIFKK